MKKVLKTLLVLFMGVFFLAGCTMKENIGMEISKNGDVKLKLIVAMDNEMIDTYLTISEMSEEEQAAIQDPSQIQVKEHTDAQRWAFFESEEMGEQFEVPEGYTSAKYDQDGFKGYIFSKDLGTLDEISKNAPSTRIDINDVEDGANGIFVKDGDNYKSNLKISSENAIDDEEMSQITQYGGMFEMYLVIDLPGTAISNNADKVENNGKTLKWDLTKAKDVELEFSLKGSSGTATSEEEEEGKEASDKKKNKDDDDEKSKLPLYIGIGCGAGLLLLVIVIIAVSASKKKKAQNAAAAMNQQQMVMAPNYAEPPVQPIQPVAQPAPVEPAPAPVAPAEPVQQPVDPNQPQQ